jgi:hypothetical protein
MQGMGTNPYESPEGQSRQRPALWLSPWTNDRLAMLAAGGGISAAVFAYAIRLLWIIQ